MHPNDSFENLTPRIRKLLQQVQINIPFTMLYDTYLDRFLEYRLNPEIGIDAEALERFELADYRRIAGKIHARRLAITLHGPFVDLAVGSTDPAIRAATRRRFEQLLDLVPIFRPTAVVCHAGYDWKRYSYFRDDWMQNSLETWSWLAGRLLEQGSRLMLENVYENDPGDMRRILQLLERQRVGFCLDAGHLIAYGRGDLNQWLEELEPYLRQLHLHDNNGGDDEHLALGRGKIDFKLLFSYLISHNLPRPIITLEPHQEADLWSSLAYLATMWPW